MLLLDTCGVFPCHVGRSLSKNHGWKGSGLIQVWLVSCSMQPTNHIAAQFTIKLTSCPSEYQQTVPCHCQAPLHPFVSFEICSYHTCIILDSGMVFAPNRIQNGLLWHITETIFFALSTSNWFYFTHHIWTKKSMCVKLFNKKNLYGIITWHKVVATTSRSSSLFLSFGRLVCSCTSSQSSHSWSIASEFHGHRWGPRVFGCKKGMNTYHRVSPKKGH